MLNPALIAALAPLIEACAIAILILFAVLFVLDAAAEIFEGPIPTLFPPAPERREPPAPAAPTENAPHRAPRVAARAA